MCESEVGECEYDVKGKSVSEKDTERQRGRGREERMCVFDDTMWKDKRRKLIKREERKAL